MSFSDSAIVPSETHSCGDLAAQLARAAYRVALKHGVEGSWIELELEMWEVLSDALDGYEQQRSHHIGQFELQEPHDATARRRTSDAVARRPK